MDIGNPITMDTNTVEDSPINVITMLGREIWDTLLDKHAKLVRDSVVDLVDAYLLIVDHSLNTNEAGQSGGQDMQRYILGYILILPLISARLTNGKYKEKKMLQKFD